MEGLIFFKKITFDFFYLFFNKDPFLILGGSYEKGRGENNCPKFYGAIPDEKSSEMINHNY